MAFFAAVAALCAAFHCFLVALRSSNRMRLNQCRVRPRRIFSTSITAFSSSMPSAMNCLILSRMAFRRPYHTRILASGRQRGPHNASRDSRGGFPLRPYRYSSHTSCTVSKLLCSTVGGSLGEVEGVILSSVLVLVLEVGPGKLPAIVAEPGVLMEGDLYSSR